ncbi:MAG: nucleotidyltransferase domain-containing protein, partial [Thermoplasmata archaeon]
MPLPPRLVVPGSFLAVEKTTRGDPFSPRDMEVVLGRGMKTYIELARLVRLGWLFRLGRGRYATIDPIVRWHSDVADALRPLRSACFYPILERTVGGILRVYSGRLLGIVLFGSASRQSARPTSDIDLAVIAHDLPADRRDDLRERAAASRTAEALTVEEWERVRHYHVPSLMSVPVEAFYDPGRVMLGVVSDGRILYDPDRVVVKGFAKLRQKFRGAGVREY